MEKSDIDFKWNFAEYYLSRIICKCRHSQAYLFFEVFTLKEVSQLGITLLISIFVKGKQGIMNTLLQGQGSFNSIQSTHPLIGGWFLNVLENNTSTAHVPVEVIATFQCYALLQGGKIPITLSLIVMNYKLTGSQ